MFKLTLIARQALLRTMEGWQQTSLLFPKTKAFACSPSISRPHAAMNLTRNKHRTSFHTLSASFTMPKLGSGHLALEFLKKTGPRVCVFSFPFLKTQISTGIHDIPAKLNSICPQFELWNSWLGESQKYDPTSVVTNDSGSQDDEHDQDAEEEGAADNVGRIVDGDNGGPDADLDLEITESIGTSPRAGELDLSPSAGAKSARSRGAGVQHVVAAAGAAKAALSSAIKGPVVSSPSVTTTSSSSNQSGRQSSFDAVYAKCSDNKVQTMKDIQASKNQCALLQQNREHHFQSQKLLLEATVADEERKVRQKIEFEKNVATLFVQDASGELARNYLALLREQEGARSAAVSSNASSPLQQFAAQFGRPLE
jgi:hypothetical protein